MEDSHRALLDRELSRALTREIREAAGGALREVIDDGIRVFERCLATAEGKAENLGVLLPFRHVLEMLDATEVLLDASCVVPSWLQLRSTFEAHLALLCVTQSDTARRGAAWLVADAHQRLSRLSQLDPTTTRGQQFRKDMQEDVDAGRIPLHEIPDQQIEVNALKGLLQQPHLAEAAAEYDRLCKVAKNPKFYQFWGGPRDLEILARRLRVAGQYQVLYRHGSITAHAEQLSRQIRDAGGGVPGIAVLRNDSHISTAYGLAISFGLRAAGAVLGYYRPAEAQSNVRKEWYAAKISPGFRVAATFRSRMSPQQPNTQQPNP